MGKQGIIVEFFGLPGSGKSTVAKRLTEKLAEEGYSFDNCLSDFMTKPRLVRALYKAWIICAQLAKSPIYFTGQMGRLVATRQRNAWDLFRLAAQYFFIDFMIKKSRMNKQCLILDQGLFQLLLSVSLNSRNPLDIDRFFDLSVKPDIVVVLRIDEKTMYERLKKRGFLNMRFDRNLISENGEMAKRATALLDTVDKYIEASNAGIFAFDNNPGNEEESVSIRLRDFIIAEYEAGI